MLRKSGGKRLWLQDGIGEVRLGEEPIAAITRSTVSGT
jgi:hypothetical protein